jgi:hypothetical protein
MKNNKHCKRESQPAHQFNANPIRLTLGLCVVLGVSAITVRAYDNPAQAAARVALEQKMYELDHPRTLLPSVRVARSEAVVKQPVQYAANVTGTVSPKAATPQTAPAPTTPVTAPAIGALATGAPAAGAPHMLILLLSLLIVGIILSLLLLKLRLHNSRSNQDLTSSGICNVQLNPFTLRLKTGAGVKPRGGHAAIRGWCG